MNLKKCEFCKTYTLEDSCKKCNKKTSEAHYKYLKTYSKENKD